MRPESVLPVPKRMSIRLCFTNMTFPPQGGRCPAGADEGMSEERERQIFYLTHPHPAAAPPPSPFQGEGFMGRAGSSRPTKSGGAMGASEKPRPAQTRSHVAAGGWYPPLPQACAVFVGAAISRPPCRHSTALSVGRDDPRRAKPLAKRTLIRPPEDELLLVQFEDGHGVEAKSASLGFRLAAKTRSAPLLLLFPADPLHWAPPGGRLRRRFTLRPT